MTALFQQQRGQKKEATKVATSPIDVQATIRNIQKEYAHWADNNRFVTKDGKLRRPTSARLKTMISAIIALNAQMKDKERAQELQARCTAFGRQGAFILSTNNRTLAMINIGGANIHTQGEEDIEDLIETAKRTVKNHVPALFDCGFLLDKTYKKIYHTVREEYLNSWTHNYDLFIPASLLILRNDVKALFEEGQRQIEKIKAAEAKAKEPQTVTAQGTQDADEMSAFLAQFEMPNFLFIETETDATDSVLSPTLADTTTEDTTPAAAEISPNTATELPKIEANTPQNDNVKNVNNFNTFLANTNLFNINREKLTPYPDDIINKKIEKESGVCAANDSSFSSSSTKPSENIANQSVKLGSKDVFESGGGNFRADGGAAAVRGVAGNADGRNDARMVVSAVLSLYPKRPNYGDAVNEEMTFLAEMHLAAAAMEYQAINKKRIEDYRAKALGDIREKCNKAIAENPAKKTALQNAYYDEISKFNNFTFPNWAAKKLKSPRASALNLVLSSIEWTRKYTYTSTKADGTLRYPQGFMFSPVNWLSLSNKTGLVGAIAKHKETFKRSEYQLDKLAKVKVVSKFELAKLRGLNKIADASVADPAAGEKKWHELNEKFIKAAKAPEVQALGAELEKIRGIYADFRNEAMSLILAKPLS